MQTLYNIFFSNKTRERTEKIILNLALISFFIHLAVIYLYNFDFISLADKSGLFINPISAVYTPFSFILIFEVYLLIYYLPRSITTYITKQYEIITLIIIRKLFKDLGELELSSEWFEIKGDLQFTYDLIGSLLLFFLIFLFQREGRRKYKKETETETETEPRVQRFIYKKKIIATILMPLLLLIALYTFVDWSIGLFNHTAEIVPTESINNLFFDQFFTVLILVDVVLLLISLFYTDQFHKIIRNSAFIISTILIRMSFGVSGAISTILIVTAVLFGLAMIYVHNRFEKNFKVEENKMT
jgi:hypothetical protein